MKCDVVVAKKGLAWPCGECEPCLVNRRRHWKARMILESTLHAQSCFVTLTYAPEQVPVTEKGLGTLVPSHLSTWLKVFRTSLAPTVFRFYGVGEYGEQSLRPHYHLILFGISRTYEKEISRTWGKGFVQVGDATPESMEYVAGYVLKKLFKKGDFKLNGRHPEFSRMSLRPGLGVGALPELKRLQYSSGGRNHLRNTGDVFDQIGANQKKLPLGRTLREKLRKEITGHKTVSKLEETSPVLRMYRRAASATDYLKQKGHLSSKEDVSKRNALKQRLKIQKSKRRSI